MRTLVLIVVVAAVAGFAATAARAASPPVVGTYTIADHGQGGWTGGPLRSDGSLGGGGAISFTFDNSHVVYLVRPANWTWIDASDVSLCFDQIHLQGPDILPAFACFALPVTGTPVVVTGPGGSTTLRVTLTS
jgi:hypothetical protein